MQFWFIRQNIGSLNNDSYWCYLPQHSSRGQKGHWACQLLQSSRGFAVVSPLPFSHPSLLLLGRAQPGVLSWPFAHLCVVLGMNTQNHCREHSKPLPWSELAKQQKYWVTLRSQLALRPVSSSDIVGACEIVKSQSNHHYSFPEYSSSAPQSVTQEAPEPKLVSL